MLFRYPFKKLKDQPLKTKTKNNKLIIQFPFINLVFVKRFVSYAVLLFFNFSLCQIQLPVSDSITNYLFAKSEKGKLSIITTNGIFELNNNSWDYFAFPSSSFKQEIKEIE